MRSRPGFLLAGSLVLVVAAASLRLYRLDHFSYGLDEILQAYWSHGSWQFFWKSLKFDAVHPPLDYLITRILEGLSPSDPVRKLPAVLWGLATLGAVWALLAQRAGRRVATVAAILLAFAPFHVRYSQELRPYSLGLALLTLSLLLLDRYLDRSNAVRLGLLYLSSLATAYTLYLAAVALAIAAAGMLAEDSFAEDAKRRRSARRFLAWSPLFAAALFLAYLPWWPVVLEAARRPAPVPAEPVTLARAARTLAFFSFAPADGLPLTWSGALYGGLALAGLVVALRRPRLRFLAVWYLGGFLLIELLGQIHPHWYVTRRYLPAGVTLPVFAALPIGLLLERFGRRFIALALAAAIVFFDWRALRVYFRHGRPDWRPLAGYLRREASHGERVFVENQYTQLCLAFYLVGPDWLSGEKRTERDLPNLEGEVVRLTWAWKPGRRAWLVLGADPKSLELRRWAEVFASFPFPQAEGAVLKRLDPALRDRAFDLWRLARTCPGSR